MSDSDHAQDATHTYDLYLPTYWHDQSTNSYSQRSVRRPDCSIATPMSRTEAIHTLVYSIEALLVDTATTGLSLVEVESGFCL